MGGGQSSSGNKTPRLSSLAIQSSLYGLPMPFGWGRARLAVNLIWYDGFKSVELKKQQQGGKGGGDNVTISYNYFADVMLGICDTSIGAIKGINAIYRDKDVFTGESTITNLSGCLTLAGFNTMRAGLNKQTVVSYLTTTYPAAALGYDTTAFLFGIQYQLNDQAGLQNHSVEVDFHNQAGGGIVDANPGDRPGNVKGIVSEFLTHCIPQWNASYIGDLTDYGLYCLASGLLLSPCLDQQTQASDLLDEILVVSNSECWVRGDGTLQIKSRGDASVTGNGVTWTPNLTPIYDLDDDDFIPGSNGDDPIKIDTENLDDIWNIVQVTYKNRQHQYNDETVTANDPASADDDAFGKRKRDPDQYSSIKDPNVARLVAQLLVQRYANFARPFVFNLPAGVYDRLEEMDYVTVTDTSLRLSRLLVRIEEIDEDDSDVLTIHAKEVLVGTANAPIYPNQTSQGVITDFNADPGDVAIPILGLLPTTITNGALTAFAAVSSTNPMWGGCEVWVTLDPAGANYRKAGTIFGGARYGSATADFPSHADPDTFDTLSVDLTVSDGQLDSGTQADADAFVTLCWLGGELVAYRDSLLTGAGTYALNYIRRGGYSTMIEEHPPGTQFVRLDDSVFKYVFQAAQIGQTLRVKFVSFNVVGKSLQKLEDVQEYSIPLTQPGVIPGAISGLGLQSPWTGNQFTVVASTSSNALTYTFRVYLADGVTLVHTSAGTQSNAFTYTEDMALADGHLARTYIVTCTPSNFSGDGPVSPSLMVSNAAPAAVTGVGHSGSGGSETISWTANAEADLAGYIGYYSLTSGFNPATGGGALFYQGKNISAGLTGLTVGLTYYVRIAAYDTWSDDLGTLNFSAEHSFVA